MEDVETATICCLCYEAVLDWHFGEIATAKPKIGEAIALAKEAECYARISRGTVMFRISNAWIEIISLHRLGQFGVNEKQIVVRFVGVWEVRAEQTLAPD